MSAKVHGPYPGYIIVVRRPETKPEGAEPLFVGHGQIHLWLQNQEGHMLSEPEAENVFRGFVEQHRKCFPPDSTFELKKVPVYVADGVPPEIQNSCEEHGPQGDYTFCGHCGKRTTLGLKPTT